MKKIFIISLAVVGLLTACDPAKQETDIPGNSMTAEQIANGLVLTQYSDDSYSTEQADGNYFKFSTSPSRQIEIYTLSDDGKKSSLGAGVQGTFKLAPHRGASPTQTLHVRALNYDGTYTEFTRDVTVYVPTELSPEMKLLVGEAGSKIWKWDTDFRADGGAWGNLGYTGSTGEEFANTGAGIWWGGSPDILNTPDQLKNAPGGQPQGDASSKAYMVFNEDGSIQTYDSLGNVIRSGKFAVTGYDGSRHPSLNGAQAEWSLGTFTTDAGTIMWPFKINGGGEEPTSFELMQLDANHLKLIYATAETGSWSEATWWAFKSNSDADASISNYSTKDWTWDVDWRADGGAWGNMGYAPGDGDSFVNSGNGIWWACAPADLTGQTQHIKGGVAQGDEDPKAYFTVDYKAGTITSYNGQGQQIRSGAYTISNWNMGKRTNASIDGSQANWSLGTLNTNAILFPWMINGNGTQVNLGLEIMQLDGNHMKLIYPHNSNGNSGSWGEATWWAFKKK